MIELVTFFISKLKTTHINTIFIFRSNMNNTDKVKSYEQKAPYRI